MFSGLDEHIVFALVEIALEEQTSLVFLLCLTDQLKHLVPLFSVKVGLQGSSSPNIRKGHATLALLAESHFNYSHLRFFADTQIHVSEVVVQSELQYFYSLKLLNELAQFHPKAFLAVLGNLHKRLFIFTALSDRQNVID